MQFETFFQHPVQVYIGASIILCMYNRIFNTPWCILVLFYKVDLPYNGIHSLVILIAMYLLFWKGTGVVGVCLLTLR